MIERKGQMDKTCVLVKKRTYKNKIEPKCYHKLMVCYSTFFVAKKPKNVISSKKN